MPKQQIPTKEKFGDLMIWLGSNAEDPGGKYEHIRQTLVKLFIWNGYWDAEDLADEAIDRVMRKIPKITIDYSGDPALYFYGVAKKILQERRRQDNLRRESQLESRLPADNNHQADYSDESDQKFECLAKCIQKLPPESRELIINYYQHEKRAKIDFRKQIAEKMDIDVESLRLKVFRIRGSLHKCIKKCLGKTALVQ